MFHFTKQIFLGPLFGARPSASLMLPLRISFHDSVLRPAHFRLCSLTYTISHLGDT